MGQRKRGVTEIEPALWLAPFQDGGALTTANVVGAPLFKAVKNIAMGAPPGEKLVLCSQLWLNVGIGPHEKRPYGMDRDFVRKRLDKIAENERRTTLQEIAGVDSSYGHGEGNCSRWILERAHAIAKGMRRAGTRMAEEVRAIAVEDASVLAEEAGKLLGYLGDSLIGAHRHRLMAGAGSRLPTIVATSCHHLAAELRREQVFAVEAVHRGRYAVHRNVC